MPQQPEPISSRSGIASELGLSLHTFHQRFAQEPLSYQSIVDGMRRSLATELLENTPMGIDQIAERIGFADATSFRKAFKNGRAARPPSSGTERLEGRLRQQHEHVQNQQHRHSCQSVRS
jgi:transcriptional regulator GlxA family with amidase domain